MRWWIIFLLVMPTVIGECYEIPVYENYYYHNYKFFAKNIELKDSLSIEQDEYSIIMNNSLTVPVSLEISYNRKSIAHYLDKNISFTTTIEPGEKKIHDDTFASTIGCGRTVDCEITLLGYKFIEPNKIRKITKVRFEEECENPWLL